MRVLMLIALVVLGGCAAADGGSVFANRGQVSMTLQHVSVGYCQINVKYTNLDANVSRPWLEFQTFDADGNTLGSHLVSFDQILPGKHQVKQDAVGMHCSKVKAAFFTRAYDQNDNFMIYDPEAGALITQTSFTW